MISKDWALGYHFSNYFSVPRYFIVGMNIFIFITVLSYSGKQVMAISAELSS